MAPVAKEPNQETKDLLLVIVIQPRLAPCYKIYICIRFATRPNLYQPKPSWIVSTTVLDNLEKYGMFTNSSIE
jgi:hypothetical protein